MDINLKQLIEEYPNSIQDAAKFKGYLRDLYPQEKQAIINILTDILACGIAEEMKANGGADVLSVSRYLTRLENEFGYSSKLAEACLQAWKEVYCVKLSVREEPKESEEQTHPNHNGKLDPHLTNSALNDFVSVGDIITFGSYWQDSKDYKQPIEWQAIDKKDGKILIISKYALDCRRYDYPPISATWETCSLREWLHDTFITEAFSKKEMGFIADTIIPVDKNQQSQCRTNPDYVTIDKVFLLSITEAKKYFSSKRAKQCKPTKYAIDEGTKVIDNGNCCWWLRTPSFVQNSVVAVDNDGFDYYGKFVLNDNVAVRPAMWINLEFQINETESDDFEIKEGVLLKYIGKEKDVIIPDGITSIGEGAFKHCDNIESIVIPDGVQSIGKWAFSECINLQKITIPNSITTIEAGAFTVCKRLQQVALPNTLSCIESWTFAGCSSLKRIVVPDGVKFISFCAFNGCHKLQNIDIPDSVEKICNRAFQACESLESIIINNSTTSIDGWTVFEVGLTIFAPKGSNAEQYAQKHHIHCIPFAIAEETDEIRTKISSRVKVGSTIQFGYWYDSKPIEWKVVDKKDRKLLVISKYLLDCQKYHHSEEDITWEKCSLRSWLKETFVKKAFTINEQKMIATSLVNADDNSCFDTNPGNATNDKVFLLSVKEAEQYFSNDEIRKSEPTEYAQTRWIHQYADWWLRSPGEKQFVACSVDCDGHIRSGYCVDSPGICVRPAMWINLDA